MTKQELELKLQDLYAQKEAFQAQETEQYTQALLPFFKDLLDETVDMEVVYNYQLTINFFPIEKKFTNSDLCSVYFSSRWDKESKEDQYNNIELSYYTTGADVSSERGLYELARLTLIGELADIILTRKDDLLQAIQPVYDYFKPIRTGFYNAYTTVDKQIRDLKELESHQKYDNFITKALEGIEFDKEVTIDLASEWESRPDIFRIISFQITNITPSGKTFEIRFGYKSSWPVEGEVKYLTVKVKADKLKRIYYQDLKDSII